MSPLSAVHSKADLIIHPYRLRILQTLVRGPATTQQISEALPDVPVSSLYRHLKILLKGSLIKVSEKRIVHGIEEKIYALAQTPRLGGEDLTDLTRDDHLHHFTIYSVTLIEGFQRYLDASDKVDYLKDRAGYTEIEVWLTDEEFDSLSAEINRVIIPALSNEPSKERQLHKLAIITHPVKNPVR